jgi:type IV pilus assembly protein PilV
MTNQKGVGFIEVLVAMTILAIGLLGVLSMQARGLQSNRQAIFTTDATLLANDMANRIMSYTDPGSIYHGIDINADTVPCNPNPAPNSIVAEDCTGWIAAFDESKLPSGRGTVEWSNKTGAYTITIRWDQDRRGDLLLARTTAVDCGNNDPTDTLTCYQLEVLP